MKNAFTVHIWDSSMIGRRNPDNLMGFRQKEHSYTHCGICDKDLPNLFYEVDHKGQAGWGFCCSEECINMYMLQKL
jgi:hypothetical protein